MKPLFRFNCCSINGEVHNQTLHHGIRSWYWFVLLQFTTRCCQLC